MQRNFFAAADDLLPVFESVGRKHCVAYVTTGMFPSPTLTRIESGASLLAPGVSDYSAYLVTPSEVAVEVRAVPQHSDGTLYAVDELANPASITLRLGRMCGREILLPGAVGTTATSGPAVVLHRAFASAIGKHFKRVQSYWVGPAAFVLLEQGTRLAIGAKASPKFDLAYECGRDA